MYYQFHKKIVYIIDIIDSTFSVKNRVAIISFWVQHNYDVNEQVLKYIWTQRDTYGILDVDRTCRSAMSFQNHMTK